MGKNESHIQYKTLKDVRKYINSFGKEVPASQNSHMQMILYKKKPQNPDINAQEGNISL